MVEKTGAMFIRAKEGVTDQELSRMVDQFFKQNEHKLEGATYFGLKSRVSGLKLIETMKKIARKHSISEEDFDQDSPELVEAELVEE